MKDDAGTIILLLLVVILICIIAVMAYQGICVLGDACEWFETSGVRATEQYGAEQLYIQLTAIAK